MDTPAWGSAIQTLGSQQGTPLLLWETAQPVSITYCSLRRARWSRILTVARLTPRSSEICAVVSE
jgi:hypothetical protein